MRHRDRIDDGRVRVVAFVAVVVASAAACHLADSPETTCTPGFHLELGVCRQDAIVVTAIHIGPPDGGGACVVDPDPFRIDAGAAFHFENDDTVAHDVHGGDGQLWASVPSGQNGPDQTIVKVGSWPYTVTACKGGTVVVQ